MCVAIVRQRVTFLEKFPQRAVLFKFCFNLVYFCVRFRYAKLQSLKVVTFGALKAESARLIFGERVDEGRPEFVVGAAVVADDELKAGRVYR